MLRMLILAVIQGVTEFIPISSSGHLVLAKHFLDFNTGDGALVEIVLHGGSLLAIIVYYRRRLAALAAETLRGERAARWELGLIALGCLPAIGVYLAFSKAVEAWFQRPDIAAWALWVTGIVVISIHWARRVDRRIDAPRALGVGIAQAFALLPGISRSGATIAAARHLGVPPERAAAFSFLMAVPLLFGACLVGAWQLLRGDCTGDATALPLFVGFWVSAIVGLASIHLLIRALQRDRFWWFGLYALALGLFATLRLALERG